MARRHPLGLHHIKIPVLSYSLLSALRNCIAVLASREAFAPSSSGLPRSAFQTNKVRPQERVYSDSHGDSRVRQFHVHP